MRETERARERQIHSGRESVRERDRQPSAIQLDLTGFYMGLLPVDFTNSTHIHPKRETATTCSV